MNSLEHSRALWNRSSLDLRSDEVLAQVLDRGSLEDWAALYELARADAQLRQRIHRIILSVPLPLPHYWLALLSSLGERVEVGAATPAYSDATV